MRAIRSIRRGIAVGALACTTLTGRAVAAEKAEALPDQSHYDESPHFPPRHHGLGVRAAVGFGGLSSSLGRDWDSSIGAPEDDTAISLDVLLGGAVGPDVLVGGAVLAETAVTDRRAVYAESAMGLPIVTRRAALVGPFAEVYPDFDDGLYLGAALGAATLRFESASSASSVNTLGLGGAVWVGEDFWLSPAWAVGPRARFLCERTWSTGANPNHDAWGDSLMLSFSVLFQ